jgi:alanine-synthesizing transaminase
LVVLSDEVYADLVFSGPVPPLATTDPEAAVIAFGSLSKGYLAPGWRAGWLSVGATKRLDNVLAAIKKLADGRLCSPVPMQHAMVAALRGDRTHQQQFRAALQERAALTAERLGNIRGVSYVPGSAAFYAMPRVSLPRGTTDEQFVLELLRNTGILFVHGSGFGTRPQDGFLRIVFLAQPSELRVIYDEFRRFTEGFLAR